MHNGKKENGSIGKDCYGLPDKDEQFTVSVIYSDLKNGNGTKFISEVCKLFTDTKDHFWFCHYIIACVCAYVCLCTRMACY